MFKRGMTIIIENKHRGNALVEDFRKKYKVKDVLKKKSGTMYLLEHCGYVEMFSEWDLREKLMEGNLRVSKQEVLCS